MIPVSNELKDAVINEVMPKRLTVTQDNSDLEKLNWVIDSGGGSPINIPSFPYTDYFSAWYSDVNSAYFGYTKYVYFLSQFTPATATNETLNLHLETDFILDNNTTLPFENDMQIVVDGKPHKIGFKVPSNTAHSIISATTATYVTFTGGTTPFYAVAAYDQIFLSDTDYDNFDDIPSNNELFATEENVKKYVGYMPFAAAEKSIEDFNWYKQPPAQWGGSIHNVDTDINLNGAVELKPSDGYANYSKIGSKGYVALAFSMKISSVTSGESLAFRVSYKRNNGRPTSYNIWTSSAFNVSEFSDFKQIWIQLPYMNNGQEFQYFYEFWILNKGTNDLNISFTIKEQQIRLYDVTPSGDLIYSSLYANDENVNKYLVNAVTSISNENMIGSSFIFKESICSAETFKLGGAETSSVELDIFDVPVNLVGARLNFDLKIADILEKFVWQKYEVVEAKRTSNDNHVVRHLVAYNDMQKLEANAYAWYTQYMWGVNLEREETYRLYQFDFDRQIFATYYNLARAYGIEGDGITREDVVHLPFAGSGYGDKYYYGTDKYLSFSRGIINSTDFEDYKAITFDMTYKEGYKNGTRYKDYIANFDSLGRGIDSACVLIEFAIDGGGTVNVLADMDDVVLLPQNWTTAKVMFPSSLYDSGFEYICDETGLGGHLTVYGVNFKYYDPYILVNGLKSLPYYSYVWRKPSLENIFKADSSITARNVMRSLMEMCGCFFKLTREGKPQFYYAQEHGLYPSNTLFPRDDLFPRKSSELTMPTSYYIRANFEEYRVSNFGGVQVVVNTYDSQGAVVRWEYWGDESSDNAYLIDDNIFLCNSQFEYEPEMAGNVQELLENLWGVLNNMSYTPFTAETIGTPFLESGDRFTLLTKNDGFESFIFERTLKGIQALKDSFEARGVAKTPRVKNFEWRKEN